MNSTVSKGSCRRPGCFHFLPVSSFPSSLFYKFSFSILFLYFDLVLIQCYLFIYLLFRSLVNRSCPSSRHSLVISTVWFTDTGRQQQQQHRPISSPDLTRPALWTHSVPYYDNDYKRLALVASASTLATQRLLLALNWLRSVIRQPAAGKELVYPYRRLSIGAILFYSSYLFCVCVSAWPNNEKVTGEKDS